MNPEQQFLDFYSPLDPQSFESFYLTQQLQHQQQQAFVKEEPHSFQSHSLSSQPLVSGSLDSSRDTEKRRKRRESHNQVERRRRDHINDRIQELSSLLPAFPADMNNKPNKGTILRRSVEYVRHLQVFAARQMDRTLELEQCLLQLCAQNIVTQDQLGLTMPLGTVIQLPLLNQHHEDDEM